MALLQTQTCPRCEFTSRNIFDFAPPTDDDVRLCLRCSRIEDEPTPERDALRALRLVLALHRQPVSANVPGFDVNLDPKAEEQVAAAVAALSAAGADLEPPPFEPFFDDPDYASPK